MNQHRPPRRRKGDGGEVPEIRKAARKAVSRAAGGAAKTAKPAKSNQHDAAGHHRPERSPAKGMPADIRSQIAKAAGASNVERLSTMLMKGADALDRGRERDAVRYLKPLRDQAPDVAAIRELLGVAQYRLGRYEEARRELDAFVELSGTVDQHPVLMDSLRALKRYRRIVKLWDELRDVSPSAELVIEGRIVMAGAMADQGNVAAAIALLEKGPLEPRKTRAHHLRLWYALADLYERSGNLPRARTLFERIRKQDPQFVDVASRVANLG